MRVEPLWRHLWLCKRIPRDIPGPYHLMRIQPEDNADTREWILTGHGACTTLVLTHPSLESWELYVASACKLITIWHSERPKTAADTVTHQTQQGVSLRKARSATPSDHSCRTGGCNEIVIEAPLSSQLSSEECHDVGFIYNVTDKCRFSVKSVLRAETRSTYTEDGLLGSTALVPHVCYMNKPWHTRAKVLMFSHH